MHRPPPPLAHRMGRQHWTAVGPQGTSLGAEPITRSHAGRTGRVVRSDPADAMYLVDVGGVVKWVTRGCFDVAIGWGGADLIPFPHSGRGRAVWEYPPPYGGQPTILLGGPWSHFQGGLF